MKCFKQLIISSVSIFFILTLAGFACDITLKTTAEISNNKVYLKDIASQFPKELSDFYVSNSPFINGTLIITKGYLKSLFKNKGLTPTICGKKITITRKAFFLTKETVRQLTGLKALNFISSMPIALPYNKYNLRLKSMKKNGRFVWIVISVFKGKKLYRNVGISAKITSTQLVPIASCDIRRGDIITQSKITLKKVIVPANKPILKTENSIKGCVAITDIRKGQFFTTSNTKKRVLVKKGDIVKVTVVENSISINTVAKALRNGFDKDIIPIMYENSKKVITAKVIGNKQVLVQ